MLNTLVLTGNYCTAGNSSTSVPVRKAMALRVGGYNMSHADLGQKILIIR